MPFVSDLMDIAVLKQEYAENQFEHCFEAIRSRYSKVRRMRKDGCCFYRAFLYQMFEYFILHKEDRLAYDSFLKITAESKDRLVKNGGYDEITIEDFFDSFHDAVKGLKDVSVEKCAEHLEKTLCNKEEANYVIMYARFITATYLKENSFLYEDFVGDVTQYCLREIEQIDVECDHPAILGITQFFNVGVEVNSVSVQRQIDVILLPEEGYDGFRPKLLYVPGHYDSLYA